MNAQLPTLSSAPPVSAWPLVQPRASFAPTPMSTPPTNANISRLLVVMFGPFSTVLVTRCANTPDRNPPTNTPSTSKTSQSMSGLVPSLRYSAKAGLLATWPGATASSPAVMVEATAPDAPSPRPITTNEASRTRPRPRPATYGFQYGWAGLDSCMSELLENAPVRTSC